MKRDRNGRDGDQLPRSGHGLTSREVARIDGHPDVIKIGRALMRAETERERWWRRATRAFHALERAEHKLRRLERGADRLYTKLVDEALAAKRLPKEDEV